MTIVTYIGNVTDKDGPTLRFTQSGKAVASFNLAINSRSKRGDEYVDDPPLFVRVNVWDDQAENVSESLSKGSRVFVTGRQKMTEFTDREGNTRQQLEVTADEVGPTLKWATAVPSKVDRRQGGGRAPQAPQQGGYGQPQGAPQGDPWAGGGNQGGYDDPVPF